MTKKYIVNSQIEYDKAIENRANQILEDYKKLNIKKHETRHKNEFKTNLRTRYVQLETDSFFVGIWNEIKAIDQDFNKGQKDFEAIEIYLNRTKINPNKVLKCLIEYEGTVKAMIRKIPDYDIQYHKDQIGVECPETLVGSSFQDSIINKPIFKPEIISDIFGILKNYFSKQNQTELKQILSTGNSSKKPLVFLDNGKKLADVFKKLYEAKFITGCEKRDLQNWISKNFSFKYRNGLKSFTPDYIEKCISRNYYPCQNPLLVIEKETIYKK